MLGFVLGEQEAVVTAVRPFDLHGVTYYDLELMFHDHSTQTARLGPEAVPDGLHAGERVLVTMAANMAVALRRP
jgi:hypothetical protein